VVRHGRGVPGLPGVAALAGRVRMPVLWERRWLACRGRQLQVRRMQGPDRGNGGHAVRSSPDAADSVVSGVLGVRHGQGRHLGARAEANTADRLVPDGVGDAAPVALGADPSRLGAAVGAGGGRRDLHRRRGGRTGRWAGQGQEGIGRRSGRSEVAHGLRALPDARHPRRLRQHPAPVHHRQHRSGVHSDHRRMERLPGYQQGRLHPRPAQPACR